MGIASSIAVLTASLGRASGGFMRLGVWPPCPVACTSRTRRFLSMMTLGAAVLGYAGWAEGGVLHVSPAGTDSPSCGAQGAPCVDIDYAVNKALSGDTVRVAGGTYVFAAVPNLCGGVTIQSVVCVVDKSVTIRGGYSPSTWAFDPVTNPTVIDGQNTYRGVYVFSSSSPNVRLTMANITITNGRAQAPTSDPAAYGGGMSVDNAAVTLATVTFQGNHAIGANSTTSNVPGGSAAGSALSIRSSAVGRISILSNVRFDTNTSQGGQGPDRGGASFGALFVFNSTVHVENSQFISNSAQAGSSLGVGQLSGARADALGGAIGVEGAGNVSLARVTATMNQASGGAGTQYGGGAFGGGVFVEDSTISIADSLFQSNVALAAASVYGGFAGGGGVMLFNSNGTIERTQIIANRATGGSSSSGFAGSGGGGGLYLWRGNAAVTLAAIQVRNTLISDNLVQLGSLGANPGGGGGGLQVQGLSANLTHVTFARNQLGTGLVVGQAMAVLEAPSVSTASVNLNYSAVADHVASTSGATALVVTTGNTLNLNLGAFSGNTHNINDNSVPLPPGTINGLGTMLSVVSAGFVSPGSPNHDYHITAGSPLRDVATGSTTTVDMDYQPRGGDPRDIGADEYVFTTCTPGGGSADVDADGIPDVIEATEGTHPCAKDNDVFLSERLFLTQQYRDFLGREADTDGLLAWMGAIGGGTSRAVVVNAFFGSAEFQGVAAPIARLYFAYFGRIPDQAGLQHWIAQYKAGMSLDAISQAFASSAEFTATYGSLTNEQFVTLVYQNVLGRAPDSAGYAYWTGQLNSGAMNRGQVMLGFSESPEYKQTSQNKVFVTLIYYGMLRRVPEQAGFDYWVGQLDSGASGLDLINGFLGATEYHARFMT